MKFRECECGLAVTLLGRLLHPLKGLFLVFLYAFALPQRFRNVELRLTKAALGTRHKPSVGVFDRLRALAFTSLQ